MNHSAVGVQAVGYWGMTMPVQARYAAWAELVLISLVSPSASFVGHLCGILAGVAWVHSGALARLTGGAGGAAAVGARLRRAAQGLGLATPPARRDWGAGASGTRAATDAGVGQGEIEDAELHEAMRRSMQDSQGPSSSGGGGAASADELRRRRLQRFG